MNPSPPPAPSPADALGPLLAQWAALVQPLLQGAAQIVPGAAASTTSAVGASAGGADVRLAGLLAQAQWLASGSLGRVVQRGTSSWGEYLRAAAPGAAGASGAIAGGSGVTVDAARLHLRRLRECALDEAHLLDTQLQALDEQLRALLDPAPAADAAAEAPAQPRRHARAKP